MQHAWQFIVTESMGDFLDRNKVFKYIPRTHYNMGEKYKRKFIVLCILIVLLFILLLCSFFVILLNDYNKNIIQSDAYNKGYDRAAKDMVSIIVQQAVSIGEVQLTYPINETTNGKILLVPIPREDT